MLDSGVNKYTNNQIPSSPSSAHLFPETRRLDLTFTLLCLSGQSLHFPEAYREWMLLCARKLRGWMRGGIWRIKTEYFQPQGQLPLTGCKLLKKKKNVPAVVLSALSGVSHLILTTYDVSPAVNSIGQMGEIKPQTG